jgi:hypothetical protein
VDEEEVDVVEAQGRQRPVERSSGVVGTWQVAELGGDEDLAPVQSAVADGLRAGAHHYGAEQPLLSGASSDGSSP